MAKTYLFHSRTAEQTIPVPYVLLGFSFESPKYARLGEPEIKIIQNHLQILDVTNGKMHRATEVCSSPECGSLWQDVKMIGAVNNDKMQYFEALSGRIPDDFVKAYAANMTTKERKRVMWHLENRKKHRLGLPLSNAPKRRPRVTQQAKLAPTQG